MADSNPAAATAADEAPEQPITFNVKSGSDQKHVFTLPLSTTVGDLKSKLSAPEYADLPADRQRLIFSGRILKDHDTLEQVKIKDGHTVHLVKSAASNARQNPANASSGTPSSNGAAAAPAVPPNMAAGTGNNPFAQLTGARHAGFHGLPGAELFGPDGGMGAPPDPSQMMEMLDDPNFLSQMNEMMNNPAMIEMLLNSPGVRDNPQARMMLQNPEFRRLMMDPNILRMQMQMQRELDGAGAGNFAMPGETDTTAQTGTGQAQGANTTNTQNAQNTQFQNLFNLMGQQGAGQGTQPNPFAALFNPPTQQPGSTPSTSPPPASAGQGAPGQPTPSGQDTQNQANPFAGLFGAQTGGQQDPMTRITQQMIQNPEMMRMAMQAAAGMMNPQDQQGGANAGAGGGQQQNPLAGLFNPFAFGGPGMGGFGTPEPQQPADNRPPEERYADQLRQLNDMGFYEFERNVQALRRSGGSVQGAVEYLLSNP